MQSYLPLLVYLALVAFVALVLSLMGGLLGPKKPEEHKYQPYESGFPTAPLMGRFPVKFYLVAMLFVIFDVEAASFYPWALQLRQLRVFGLWEMVAFLAVLAVGYAYVWKKGGFSWK
ncbi:MAG: NADH-quinone oxidoreductase subunit A [Bacillota bacterium]